MAVATESGLHSSRRPQSPILNSESGFVVPGEGPGGAYVVPKAHKQRRAPGHSRIGYAEILLPRPTLGLNGRRPIR